MQIHLSLFLRPRFARHGLLFLAAALLCLVAPPARAQYRLTVNTLADTVDSPDNCGEPGGTGKACSLRDAIYVANYDNLGDPVSFSVTGTITLTSELPGITGSVSFTGPGATLLTISGANTYRGFNVSLGVSAAFSGLTIANGHDIYDGGGILANGPLHVDKCTFYGNTTGPASGGAGGGAIYVNPDNAYGAYITNSTFVNNSSGDVGGAILGYAQIENSTFSGNYAPHGGGAFYNVTTSFLYDNTFSGNSSDYGGAIYNGWTGTGTAFVSAYNNLISGNTATTAGAGIYNLNSDTVTDAYYTVYYNNLTNGIEDDCNNCASNSNATSAGSNPLALPLGYYGGPTMTFLPQPGSEAICAATAQGSPNTSDQRGYPLTTSYSQCPAGKIDAGAVQTNYLQVQSGGDAGAGSSDCNPVSANCTLRDAIVLASASPADISFSPSLSKVNLNAAIGTLALGGANAVNIVGPGASLLTVNGNGSSPHSLSVFTVDSSASATLYGLTISGGYAGSGGGIYNQGTLAVLKSAVSGNTGGIGGGIDNAGALTVQDSTISGNTAPNSGGGIYNNSGDTASIVESTLYGNKSGAIGDGGGIYNDGTLTITGSTVWENTQYDSSGYGGGIYNIGALTLANSILAGNTTLGVDANFYGSYTDGGGNVVGGNSPANNFYLNGNTGGPLITMSGLQSNGLNATLQTLIPLPGSPAICAAKTVNIPSGITADERGYLLQPTGGYCSASEIDAGAVQTNYTSVAFVQQPSSVSVDVDMSPAPTVEVLETDTLSNNTDPVGGISVTITPSGGTYAGSPFTLATSTISPFLASLSSLDSSTAAGNISLSTSSIPVTGSYSLAPVSSNKYDVLGAPSNLTSPAPNSVLTGPKITFNWSTSPGATAYKLWIGSAAGKNDVYTSGTITTTSATASLPTNGATLYATLVTVYGSSQVYNHYVYTATTAAALTSPTPSTTLAGPKVTFNWSAAPGATAYKLWIGSSAGKNNLFTSGTTTSTSATPGALPTNGETVYLTLITVWGASQVINDYTFTAATAASLTSPTPSTVLAGRTITFNWSAASGATGYKLWIGTSPGTYNLYTSGTITTTSVTTTMPTNGETLHATLVTVYGTILVYNHYTFTAATPAALTSPTPGTQLPGAQVTFNWSAAPGATAYKLWIGSSAGKNDLYSSGPITVTTATPTKLPTNGETVFVTLVTVYPASTVNAAYTFTAAP